MPAPTKPQLALYAAFAIAVLLIGGRFLRTGDEDGGVPPLVGDAAGAAPGAAGLGAPDGAGGAADLLAGVDAAGGVDGAGDGSGRAGGAGELVVDVKGAVRRPGVYRLPAGARAMDAVERAGGVTRRADRLAVNLAARVVDGGEVVVPRKGRPGVARAAVPTGGMSGATAGGGAVASGGAADGPLQIDINTATAQELEQLDGVGPATAAKIIAYREQHGGFASIDELIEVSGIGEAKLAAIRTQLGL